MKIVEKIWGRELILICTSDYIMKVLEVKSGCGISLQYHKEKEETWYVSEGSGIARFDGKQFPLSEGDFLHIPPNMIHKVDAITDMKIVEASSVYLDDIVRL